MVQKTSFRQNQDFITVGCASVTLSDSVKNLCVTLDCHLTMKTHVSNLVRSANFELCRISSICHLSTDATKTLVSAFVLSTNYRRFRTTLLALFGEFLKWTTFLFILLLFIGCPLIQRYSTNSLFSVIIASTRLRSSSDTSIVCIPTVRTHSLGQKSFFLCCASSLEHSPI